VVWSAVAACKLSELISLFLLAGRDAAIWTKRQCNDCAEAAALRCLSQLETQVTLPSDLGRARPCGIHAFSASGALCKLSANLRVEHSDKPAVYALPQ
jgi:hypothetical protein